MLTLIRGRVWKFGDNIDTDVIFPARYIPLRDLTEMAKHAMEPINKKFSQQTKPGDIIVAGRNFGCGSNREGATVVFKQLGISLILAESFARTFFRNAINIGLPVLECKGIASKVQEGDELEVNLETGEIKNITTGQLSRTAALSAFILNIIKAGGATSALKAKFTNIKK